MKIIVVTKKKTDTNSYNAEYLGKSVLGHNYRVFIDMEEVPTIPQNIKHFITLYSEEKGLKLEDIVRRLETAKANIEAKEQQKKQRRYLYFKNRRKKLARLK